MSDALGPDDPPLLEQANAPAAVPAGIVVAGRLLLLDLLLLLAWVAAADWLLYQIGSYFTWGIFLFAAVGLLAIAKRGQRHLRGSLLTGGLLVLLASKLIWCGSLLQIVCGTFLILCYAMALTGWPPFLPEVIAFLAGVCIGAIKRLRSYRFTSSKRASTVSSPSLGIRFLLPTTVVVVFGALFVLANPDMAEWVGTSVRSLFDSIQRAMLGFDLGEAVFWLCAGALLLGLLYPAKTMLLDEKRPSQFEMSAAPSPLYLAYSNTLLSVIGLFAVYLCFEFSTLWFREFPENFYYAGYAHRGAFWLTLALALATLVLSTIFHGSTLSDPRLKALKRLAVIWSIENMLLSAAVYNRLFIYIDFNGMTRMRVVGLLGITAVVAGFTLVVVKLLRDRDFIWLLHRQLWVPVIAIVLYAILPVDWLVNRFNARQVTHGNLAPSVQIVAHETTAEGILPLIELVDCQDATIREGVRGLLALWALELGVSDVPQASAASDDSQLAWRSELGHATPWLDLSPSYFRSHRQTADAWQELQLANVLLINQLKGHQTKWQVYAADRQLRDDVINRYFQYAYQWY